jgi:hypothetical protein
VRVFVLTTGRSGSVTFAKACAHITNYSTAHESKAREYGPARFAYPDQHIEVDNRLSWFLGMLGDRFPDARFVHLVRDRDATARSFAARWAVHPPPPAPRDAERRAVWQQGVEHPRASLVASFGNGLIMRREAWPEEERLEVAGFLVDTVNANIRMFLRGRDHLIVRLESVHSDFTTFWDWVGASGDRQQALLEWDRVNNATVV